MNICLAFIKWIHYLGNMKCNCYQARANCLQALYWWVCSGHAKLRHCHLWMSYCGNFVFVCVRVCAWLTFYADTALKYCIFNLKKAIHLRQILSLWLWPIDFLILISFSAILGLTTRELQYYHLIILKIKKIKNPWTSNDSTAVLRQGNNRPICLFISRSSLAPIACWGSLSLFKKTTSANSPNCQ